MLTSLSLGGNGFRRCRIGQPAKRAVEPLHPSLISSSVSTSGGRQAHDIVAGRYRQEPLLHRRLHHIEIGNGAFEPDHQTLAADLLDQAGIGIAQPRQMLAQPER